MLASDRQAASFRTRRILALPSPLVGEGKGEGVLKLLLLFGFCFLILAGACAKKPPKPKPKPEVSIPSIPTPPPAPPVLSPKREASQKIVQTGKEYLAAEEWDKAAQTFQEAINVDPENGVAYFFLALSLFQSKQYHDAQGLLDRADTLLAPYPQWHDEVLRLRLMIEEAGKEGQQEKPSDQEVYY